MPDIMVSETSPADSKPAAFSGEVVFNDSITIFSGNRLPQYDKGPVKAFAARGQGKAPPHLFAMICEDHLVPRSQKASNYAALINPSLVRLVASGTVDWPPAGRQKYCFIYENTLGNPLMRDDLRGGSGMKADVVLTTVIRPMVSVLADLRDKDMVHGNIRPSNIFDGGVKNFERVILGECLSLPVSYNSPVLYEPIERGLTSPIGRGLGMSADDLYSFGASVAMLMRQFDFPEGMTDDQVIERKIEEGSYTFFLGNERFTGAILELLRGLLHDDENQRWTLDEVNAWLDGRRLTPKQVVRKLKANRPLTFNNQKYMRPELIARDLGKSPNEAKTLIEGGEVEQWLTRALDDKPAMARYEAAIKQSEEGGKGPGYPERLVTRVAMALHPQGPLRFRSVNIMPDGIGTALAEAFMMKRDLQHYTEFFMSYFITQWIDVQPGTVSDVSNLVSKFDGARAYLRHKGMGMGLERCLYSLCPELHCLSEKLQKFYIRSPEDILSAFEKTSKSSDRPALFFDRHIIAFLCAKDRKTMDAHLGDLNAPEFYRRILAEIKILAAIQKRSQMGRFPGIAAWMVDMVEPLYERFHDRRLREDLKKRAERLKETGDLSKIVDLFDSHSVQNEDMANFRKSMRFYRELSQEMDFLERDLRTEETLGRETGQRVASMVSGFLSVIIILAMVFMAFHKGAKFF